MTVHIVTDSASDLTAAPAPGAFPDAFTDAAGRHADVVCITMSADLSGTAGSARTAAGLMSSATSHTTSSSIATIVRLP